jgi:hypothetical protein
VYPAGLAAERVAAAAAAAHAGPHRLVLTARAENHLHGRDDLADTIARLQSFQEAGADVLYAPGLTRPADIAAVVSSVDRPVNVLALPSGPGVAQLAELGVSRVSVGGGFAFAALDALVVAARELLDEGTVGFAARAARSRDVVRSAFSGGTRPPQPGPAVPHLRQVVLDCPDARALAEFYRHLLGLEYRPGDEPPEPGHDDGRGRDWLVLRSADGVPRLAFQQVDRLLPPTWPDGAVPQQLHLDLTVPSAGDLQVQHERVLRLGGRLLFDRSDDPDEPLRVYADPAGHPFCVFVA